jgi:hypothetical protein
MKVVQLKGYFDFIYIYIYIALLVGHQLLPTVGKKFTHASASYSSIYQFSCIRPNY